MSEELELTILMPCLNEALTVGICVAKARAYLENAGIHGEVLVADNGSTDGSQNIAAASGARVVTVVRKGYGAALAGGIRAARGRYVIMADADDSYDFTNPDAFLTQLRDGNQLVMGNRFLGGIKRGAMPILNRYLGNPILSFIGRRLFAAEVGDFHCGLRGFERQSILGLDLRAAGMEFASEMVVKASLAKLRITEVPTTLSPDGRGRPPHLRPWRDGWRHLRFMLLYAPNWLFLLPGGSLVLFGLLLVSWLMPGPRRISPHVVLDIHTMIFGVMFTLLGVQILSIGTFAKVFSYAERFDRNTVSLKRVLKRVRLETGLLLGGALFFAGFAGCAWVAWEWAASGFGPLHEVRQVLFWSMWLFIGVQVIFASFFLSMLGISRGTYIGDYDLK